MNEIQYSFRYERSAHGVDDVLALLLRTDSFREYYKDESMARR
jgi:hypothetical protein